MSTSTVASDGEWNRRARKRGGKVNPPHRWIWSEAPAHEALVSREMFEEAARRGVARDNTTKAARGREGHAPRTHLLRSFLRCGVCGLRMLGQYRHGVAYYVCQASRRRSTLLAPGHPRTVYLREDRAVEKVLHFPESHLFGPGRREELAQALEATNPEKEERLDDAEGLRGEVADLALRIRRHGEPGGAGG